MLQTPRQTQVLQLSQDRPNDPSLSSQCQTSSPAETAKSTETSAFLTALRGLNATERLRLISSLLPPSPQPSQPQLPQADAPLPPSSDDDTTPLDDATIAAIDAEVDGRMAAQMMTIAETKCRWRIVPPNATDSGVPVGLFGQIYTLNDMNRGDAFNGQRIAARVHMKKLYLKWFARANPGRAAAQFVRVIVFIDKQNRIDNVFNLSVNELGLLDNFFEPSSRFYRAFLAHKNFLGIDYTHFLHDEVIELQAYTRLANYSGYHGKIDLDLRRWTTTFQAADVDNIGVNVTNALKIAFIGDVLVDDNPPQIQFTSALEYMDA